MKQVKRILAVVLAALMLVGLMACGEKESDVVETTTEAETTTTAAEKETEAESKETEGEAEVVELVLLLTGDEPNDMNMVEDELNKIFVEKFNAKIDCQFTTWTDFTTKYQNALLTGGCDFCYGAVWLSYGALAKKGAYMALDDLLAEYAADLVEACDPSRLNASKVNGKIYGFPCMMPSYVITGLAYRADLAETYDLPLPEESFENFEAYFNGVAANAADAGLVAVLPNGASGASVSTWQSGCAALLNYNHPEGVISMQYGYLMDNHDPSNLIDYWYSEDFVEDAKLMKKWCDAGWWSRSCISAEYSDDQLADGTLACICNGTNASKWAGWVQSAIDKGNDFDIRWYEYANITGVSYPAHPTQNLTCIAASCEHPEKCVQILQEVMLNQEVNDLMQSGIEGYHYNIDDEGFYVATEEGTNNYGYEGANSWNFMNKSWRMKLRTDVAVEAAWAHDEEIGDKMLYPNTNIIEGFSFNAADFNIDAESSAISNVCAEKLNQIFIGLVDDPEAAVKDFQEAVKAADLDVCREVYAEQWKAYCEEYGFTGSDK